MNVVLILLLIVIIVIISMMFYFLYLSKKNGGIDVLNSRQIEKELEIEKAVLSLQIENLKKDIEKYQRENLNLNSALEKIAQEKNTLLSQNSGLEATNKSLLENQDRIKQEIEELQKTTKLQFEKIASEILEEKTNKFTESNKINIETILKPLESNIKEFKENIHKNLTEETKQRTSLENEIKKVLEQTNIVSEQANNLANALKGSNKTAGNWGENILETILQNSGLIEGEHYSSQETFIDQDNKMKRPDVLVYLPDERIVIIDSKVSLVAYDNYFSSQEETSQALCLNQHIQSIRKHIDDLHSKKYDELKNALDFTMMFIPIESAYLLAMQNDKGLWEYAYKKRIILVSATTLISSLRIIADLWGKDKQNKNALKIMESCEKMYDKLISFLDNFEKIGKNLEIAKESYDKAFGQLKIGKGNLISRASNIIELGVKSNKSLPDRFSDYEE